MCGEKGPIYAHNRRKEDIIKNYTYAIVKEMGSSFITGVERYDLTKCNRLAPS